MRLLDVGSARVVVPSQTGERDVSGASFFAHVGRRRWRSRAARRATCPTTSTRRSWCSRSCFLVVGPMMLPQITRLVTGKTLANSQLLDRRCDFLETLARHLDAEVR